MHEQFKPEMRIVAVDSDQALITFDSNAAYDIGRSPVALRIPRNFASIKLQVGSVVDVPDGNYDSKRLYRGSLSLQVVSATGTQDHPLAQLDLHIAALSKPKRGIPASDFPPASAVTAVIRQGAADALARALDAFSVREGELAAIQRSPVGAYPITHVVDAAPRTPLSVSSIVQSTIGHRNAANDSPADRKNFRKQMLVAAIVTPILVIGLMWATSKNKPADPIQDAVAQAMVQNPAAAQAQVELTKATLKEMGLDPGAAGDTGCLATQ